jgi:hypothetical protein
MLALILLTLIPLYFIVWYWFATRKLRFAVNRVSSLFSVPNNIALGWILINKKQMGLIEFEAFIERICETSASVVRTNFRDLECYIAAYHPNN